MWGVQDYIYKNFGNDAQSLWCVGQPANLDPEFDDYIPNTNAWTRWGPIDLTDAVAAKANFWYFNISQPYSDYVRWGASPGATWSMYEAGRHSGTVNDWMCGCVDFDSLAEGTVSLLGLPTVYVQFQFFSNYDTYVERGAFIDEVSISWDDGLFDLVAQNINVVSLDSLPVGAVFLGDTVLIEFNWKAYGTGETPLFDIGSRMDGEFFYSERRSVDIGTNQVKYVSTYSDPWIISDGEHLVEWSLDVSEEVDEAVETNNDTSMVFEGMEPNQPPWIEFTHPVYGDTANQQFLITWEDEDPDDNALIYLYWDDDSTGYDGQPILGATQIPEDDETDAFLWNVASFADGEFWVFAYMMDIYNYIYKYSYGPLIVDHDWMGVAGPEMAEQVTDFRLTGVYPNPFNSSTRVKFALPAADQITVRIYDSLGRLCVEPYQGWLTSGLHEISWSPENLPSGLYLIQVSGQSEALSTKAMYLK